MRSALRTLLLLLSLQRCAANYTEAVLGACEVSIALSNATQTALTAALRKQETFALQSGARGLRGDTRALARTRDLMVRGGFPVDEATARGMGDAQLLRMAMLAAVGGISPWQRHANLTDRILLVSTAHSFALLCD